MQLTLHADYALRVLLYLATHPPAHVASTRKMSDVYGISKNHLARVVQTLERHGYVQITSGCEGGVSLAREPRDIRLGQVVRDAEVNLSVVECFEAKTNTCPITLLCRLKPALKEAVNAFLAELDRYTLADVAAGPEAPRLLKLFSSLERKKSAR